MFFKKKEKIDDLGNPEDLLDSKFDSNNLNPNQSNEPDPFSLHHQELDRTGTTPAQPEFHEVHDNEIINSKNFEILNSKLDSIKSELDALRQHVLRIEQIIDSNKKRPMW